MLAAGKDIKQKQIAGQGHGGWIWSGGSLLVAPRNEDDNVLAALSLSACIKLLLATFCERDFRDSRGTEEPLDKTNGHLRFLLYVFHSRLIPALVY